MSATDRGGPGWKPCRGIGSGLAKRRPCRSSQVWQLLPGCSHEDTMVNPEILTILEQRLGRRHARQRLGIEKDHEAQVFGQGINFFHIENLVLSRVLIRAALTVTGLYRRGLRNAAKVGIRHNRIEFAEPAEGFRRLHHRSTKRSSCRDERSRNGARARSSWRGTLRPLRSDR